MAVGSSKTLRRAHRAARAGRQRSGGSRAGGQDRGTTLAGFTLIDLVVGFAVFAIAIGSIYWVLMHKVTASEVTDNYLQAQQNAQTALDRLVEEARWSDGVAAATTSPASVTFHVPGQNPLMANQDYQVVYALQPDGTLQRTITPTGGASVTSSLATHISDLTLTFYDEANPPNALSSTDAAQAYQVQVTVTVTVGQQSRGWTSTVFLREKP